MLLSALNRGYEGETGAAGEAEGKEGRTKEFPQGKAVRTQGTNP